MKRVTNLTRRYFIESTKLAALGWEPKVTWAEGLKLTIQWYVDHVHEKSYWENYEHVLCAHPHPVGAISPSASFNALLVR